MLVSIRPRCEWSVTANPHWELCQRTPGANAPGAEVADALMPFARQPSCCHGWLGCWAHIQPGSADLAQKGQVASVISSASWQRPWPGGLCDAPVRFRAQRVLDQDPLDLIQVDLVGLAVVEP